MDDAESQLEKRKHREETQVSDSIQIKAVHPSSGYYRGRRATDDSRTIHHAAISGGQIALLIPSALVDLM